MKKIIEKYENNTISKTPSSSLSEFETLLSSNPDSNLIRLLNPKVPLGAAAIEHIVKSSIDLPKSTKASALNSDQIASLYNAFEATSFGTLSPCISITKKVEKNIDGVESEITLYEAFHSHKFAQLNQVLEYSSFNEAIDDYFSSIRKQKDDQDARKVEKQAVKKLDNARKNHELQLEKLRISEDENRIKAQLLEANIELVDQAISIVNSMIANRVSWPEIEQLLSEAKLKNDPVAKKITSLKLEQNKIVVLLSNQEDIETDRNSLFSSDDSDSEPEPDFEKIERKVEIDLSLNAYGNVSSLHSNKKTAVSKQEKTEKAGSKALKSAELKAKSIIKQAEKIQQIRKARKIFWWEKFLWFITSENYLVIAGRDAQQNEILVKKYLNPGDAYIHADIHGASSVILKNHTRPLKTLPPKSLEEAGNFALLNSSAWDAKIVTKIYWVEADQVSKTAQSGEYLPTGSFMVRGKKNYLPSSVQQLMLGYGILFNLEEDSLERHVGERKVHENVVLEDHAMQSKVVENKVVENDSGSDFELEPPKLPEPLLEKSENATFTEKLAEMKIKSAENQEMTEKPEIEEEYEFPEVKMKEKKRSLPQWKIDQQETKNNNKQVRGKKGKNKKIKNKYGDQDEEEREMIMQMLQSENAKKSKKLKGKRSNNHAGSSSRPAATKLAKQAVVR